MIQLAMIFGALAVAGAGASATAAETSDPPQRIRSVQLARGQLCPVAAPGEVVVCAPADDPYRIPAALRRSRIAERTTSWVNRAADLDEAGRIAAGLPDTCSPIGTGGQTGCTQAMIRQWAAERRAARMAP
ncbi:hypothetical protein [Sphingomonas sp.]|uniref:hypothetical protein n=1 Tax=Sphingomonas sp. TaxID=28214 RepID=UPI003CC57A13